MTTEDSASEEEENDEFSESDEESITSDNAFTDAINESVANKRQLEFDTDEEEDVEDELTGEHEPPKKKRKKKKLSTANMKPPTAEEMIRLRETENLFHSNLFRMQIEEMIKEVRPNKAVRKQVKPWIEKLRELLLNIDESTQKPLTDTFWPPNVESPLPGLPPDTSKGVSSFLKPLSVSAVGSYAAGCCLGPSLSVDVVAVMPKKCFLKEDYLNGRYHRKRAQYLARLAGVLQGSELVTGVRWALPWDPLSPRLVVTPTGKLDKVQVTLSVVPQQDTFKLSRFSPDKNNTRESWLSYGKMEDCHTATPMYNTSVLRDMVMTANEAVRQQTLENNNNLKEAITLLRVWLRQRQLDVGPYGFSGYLASMLVVALFRSHRLNSLMSSYQITRNVWLYLSQTDWTKEGLTMCSTKHEENTPSLQDFHSHFDVVFVDTTGHCNLAAGIHRLTYQRVKQEAQLAVECLDNQDMNSFQALFMTPMPFLRQFDHIIRVKTKKILVETVLKRMSSTEIRVKNYFATEALFISVVTGTLETGLGGRLEMLAYQLPVEQQWPVARVHPKPYQNLVLGLRLNTETAYSIIEKGPPANEPQAEKFRELWGSLCELRRFRDGTVCEAVVWAKLGAPLSERRLVTQKMAMHLLQKRLGMFGYYLTYAANQLETFVTEKALIPDRLEYGTGEEVSQAAVRTFDSLAKQVRELPDLPLDVSGVHGISAVLRGAEVFPPVPWSGRPQAKTGMEGPTCWMFNRSFGKAPDYITPIEGVIELGLSRKWPEDPEAVRRIRAAFNIHIAKAILEKYDLQTQAYTDHIDVFKEGFVFRLRVVYPREVVLLKECKTPDGKTSYRDTPESLQLEKYTLHLPKLTGALHGLQQQWPSMGVVCRLAKRWLSSQLLDNAHVPDVATELLVASLFLSPEPFRPLAQPQPMFLRFLHLLAHTNFHLEPVVVNFNGNLKREDLIEIESHFRSERTALPPLYIATQYDKSGSVWTREAPTLPVLVRLASLASQSLTVLETNFLSSALSHKCKVVFRPPLELYDALIRLKPMQLSRLSQGVDFTQKTPVQVRVPKVRRKIPITGFDPAEFYLRELRESYSDFALFFHDTYGGRTIGVLFKPSAFETHEFKVSQVNCRKPVKEGKKELLTLNFDAIIEDFYILGTGLVQTIHLSPKHSQKMEHT
ncbi:Nucleolar protein 6 [Homalodisca vitripennis]|nr:Nucleolar protein 6 [Homalodisca vitripennis]